MATTRVSNNAEHWQRLSRVESDLDVLKPQVAGLQTDVQYIRSSIDQLVAHNVATEGRTFPWGAIVSLVSVVVLILGGFATMLTQPIAQMTAYNQSQIERNQEESSDLEEQAAYLKGRVEEMSKKIDEIDIYGSRKWNGDTLSE